MRRARPHPLAALVFILGMSGLLWAVILWGALHLAGAR